MQFWRKFIQINVYSSFHKLAECVHSRFRFELDRQIAFIQAFHVSSMQTACICIVFLFMQNIDF